MFYFFEIKKKEEVFRLSELRKCPITGRWVIIAVERAKRPTDFAIEKEIKKGGFCPFCYGNEHITPPEIYAIREPNTKPNTEGWKVRVVPNKFPALQREGELHKKGIGLYDWISGIGAHEVIIESPFHELSLAELPLQHFELVIKTYINRIKALYEDERIVYVQVFKNHGAIAGASLEHSHTQIIAIPTMPKAITERLNAGLKYYEFKERCLFCDIIWQEEKEKERIVMQSKFFLAYCPYASRFPFEVTIIPYTHSSDFTSMREEEIADFSYILKSTLLKLKHTLNDPPYNFVLHTIPNEVFLRKKPLSKWHTLKETFHWHLEILPRLTKVAGFEWGTDFYINPTPPEVAARFLRETKIE